MWEFYLLITQIMFNKFEIFWFKYFSANTANTSDGGVRRVVAGVMCIPLLIAFFFTVVDMMAVAKVFGLIYAGLLVAFAIVWIFVFFYHNWRIKHEI